MSRLFVTSKEAQYLQDIAKEVIKDVIGQYIYYYPVSIIKTSVHPVYEEAVKKIFDNPIKLDALIDQPKPTSAHNLFGAEQRTKLEVYVQGRDLIDKSINLYIGDFFTYGSQAYEIIDINFEKNLFGQVEYEVGYKLTGMSARVGQFDPKTFFNPVKDGNGPYEQTNVQQTFVQQRGLSETEEGTTGDFRQVRDRLKDDLPEIALGEGPREVKPLEDKKASSIYSDD